MKKRCVICGKAYSPKDLFIKINKDFYFCEKCFRRNFGEIYEYDEKIDEVWKEINEESKKGGKK